MIDIDSLKYDYRGLIPAIITDCVTGEVLMLAYMNRKSLEISISEGMTCFWSRSRSELWRKGETSGNVQHIVSIKADCDLDTLIVSVRKEGPACHTGAESCFFEDVYEAEADAAGDACADSAAVAAASGVVGVANTSGATGASGVTAAANAADTAGVTTATAAATTAGVTTVTAAVATSTGAAKTTADGAAVISPSDTPASDAETRFTLNDLYDIIADRKTNVKEGSYTTYLFEKGIDKILKKLGEESTEVIIAGKAGDIADTIYEIGDLAYHAMVLMVEMGISPEDIIKELASRHVIDNKVKQEKMT